VVDVVVAEPGDGAHSDHAETARRLRAVIVEQLDVLSRVPIEDLLEARYRRFRELGPYTEIASAPIAPTERPGLGDRLRNIFDPTRWPAAPARDEPPARDGV
ncbi:MAG TPA: hypothetical protein VF231_06585, partial [Candidatus Limnocylindrales bacterium]